MIKEGSRVKHIDPQIDIQKGVMSVLNITNGFATCWYQSFDNMQMAGTYHIKDLILSNN
ncbi:hypothetical protein [Epilithonimonas sp.]|uniref:hypothetical protein n=1 Tax=Epilithonimonas sp. TaxID=2894511 RepID=UPI0035AE2F33